MGIIDELSYRELLILRTLEEFEKRLIGSVDDIESEKENVRVTAMNEYWTEFQNTVSELTEGLTLVPALMKRLERSGLFQVANTVGNTENDNYGFLTDLYYDLKNDLTNISPLPSTAEG